MLYLIRGLPGSGKTTLAKKLTKVDNARKDKYGISCAITALYHEADMFFEDPVIGYHFDPKFLPQAHDWCYEQTRYALELSGTAIVSNTFSRIWEMQPYLDMAEELDIPVTVITCEGNYGSTHDVPDHAIERMKERWEAYP